VNTDNVEFWIERDEWTTKLMSSKEGELPLTEFVIFADGTWAKSINGNVQEKSL